MEFLITIESEKYVGILINTIIPFLFILTVLVFVHELGHYIAYQSLCKS